MLSLLRKFKKDVRRKLTQLKISDKSPVNKAILTSLMDGHAYIHDEEIALFSHLAEKSIGPIVEIGCAFGASSSVFLLKSRIGVKIHSIDPFIQDSMRAFQSNESRCKKNVNEILKAYGKKDKYTDWTLHTDYSFNVVKKWNEQIDIIFIDGDHTHEAVKKDFEDWFPHVKVGGLIMLHDSRKEDGTPADTFNRGWAGPTKLAHELKNLDIVTLIEEAFSVTVWQKR